MSKMNSHRIVEESGHHHSNSTRMEGGRMSDTTTTKYGVYRHQGLRVSLGPFFDDWDDALSFCHKRDLTGESGWSVYEVTAPSDTSTSFHYGASGGRMSTHRVEVLVSFSVDDDSKDQDIRDALDELTCALAQVDHRIYSTDVTLLTIDGNGFDYERWADDNDLG